MKCKIKCLECAHITANDDPGKDRYCERAKGHTGLHMAYYRGKRRYWKGTYQCVSKSKSIIPKITAAQSILTPTLL